MSQERRRSKRFPTAMKLEVQGQSAWMMAHDVSLGGMCVTSGAPRWPGELLRLRFRLPGEPRAICATCRVVGLQEAPIGVGLDLSFMRLAPEARAALRRFVHGVSVAPRRVAGVV